MKRILGAIVAGGLWLGSATAADAQFSLSIGSPYAGGVGYGLPGYYGYPSYGSAYVAPGATFYGSGYSGYSGYVAPGTTYFNSGYYAPSVGVYSYPAYGYSYARPYYGGYRPYYGGGWRGGGRWRRW